MTAPTKTIDPAALVTDAPMDPVRTYKVDVSPATAEAWLAYNHVNRNIRRARVAQYAADMAANNWQDTGETIKFDKHAALVDGQHRLTALVEAGVTVPLRVMFGLEPSSRHYVDTGAARTASDALRMQGEPAPAILAASARMGILLERGHVNAPVSHSQVFDYIEAHPTLRDAAAATQGLVHKIDLNPSIMAYGRFRFGQIDPVAAAEFFDKLANLNDLGSDDPILRFAHRLRQMNRNDEKVEKRVLAVTLFRIWNYWRQGKAMQRVLFAAPSSPLPDLV